LASHNVDGFAESRILSSIAMMRCAHWQQHQLQRQQWIVIIGRHSFIRIAAAVSARVDVDVVDDG
jgi:hypothetical protein